MKHCFRVSIVAVFVTLSNFTSIGYSNELFSKPGNFKPTSGVCQPALDAGSIKLPPHQAYVVCESTSCKMYLTELYMGLGSVLYLPPKCSSFELKIRRAVFKGGNTIFLERSEIGARGPYLDLAIDRAELEFSPMGQPVSPADAIAQQLNMSNQIASSTSAAGPINDPSMLGKYDWGLWIHTRGGPGANGLPGDNGSTPHKSGSCKKMDGPDKPTPGSPGHKGGKGGPGGVIDVRIYVASSSRATVTERDIILDAKPGSGGHGGPGGIGGGPVAGIKCKVLGKTVFSHGGHTKEPDGTQGPHGDPGEPGTVHRHIRLIN